MALYLVRYEAITYVEADDEKSARKAAHEGLCFDVQETGNSYDARLTVVSERPPKHDLEGGWDESIEVYGSGRKLGVVLAELPEPTRKISP